MIGAGSARGTTVAMVAVAAMVGNVMGSVIGAIAGATGDYRKDALKSDIWHSPRAGSVLLLMLLAFFMAAVLFLPPLHGLLKPPPKHVKANIPPDLLQEGRQMLATVMEDLGRACQTTNGERSLPGLSKKNLPGEGSNQSPSLKNFSGKRFGPTPSLKNFSGKRFGPTPSQEDFLREVTIIISREGSPDQPAYSFLTFAPEEESGEKSPTENGRPGSGRMAQEISYRVEQGAGQGGLARLMRTVRFHSDHPQFKRFPRGIQETALSDRVVSFAIVPVHANAGGSGRSILLVRIQIAQPGPDSRLAPNTMKVVNRPGNFLRDQSPEIPVFVIQDLVCPEVQRVAQIQGRYHAQPHSNYSAP